MAIITPHSELNTEAVQVTSNGDKQRVMYTTPVNGTIEQYSELFADVVVDVDGERQRAIPVVSFGTVGEATVESVNAKTGVVVLTAQDIETENGSNVLNDLHAVRNDVDDMSDDIDSLQRTVNVLIADIDGVANALDALNGEVR